MTPLHLIIDTLLPGDHDLGMPSASQIDFDTFLEQKNLVTLAHDFVDMVDELCVQKHSLGFEHLPPEQRLQMINACKLVDVRLFTEMVSQLLRAYYTAPGVLVAIGAGSVPPFPEGHALESDDWTLLEPVHVRGPFYREAP